MRIGVLENGHKLRYKLMMKAMSVVIRGAVPDVIKTTLYRRPFFGKAFGDVTHHAIQESDHWKIGECELFAAFVSKQNQCPF